MLLSIKSLEKNWSKHENKCISESMSFFDGLLMRLVRIWCEIDAHNGVEMSVPHKPKIARIARFVMIATHEDFHTYILVNVVVDNFLMRFWILVQHFGSYIFIPKDASFTLYNISKIHFKPPGKSIEKVVYTTKKSYFKNLKFGHFSRYSPHWIILVNMMTRNQMITFCRPDTVLSFGVLWSYLQSNFHHKKSTKKPFYRIFTKHVSHHFECSTLDKNLSSPSLTFLEIPNGEKREGGIWKMNKSNLIDWKIKAKLNNFFETIFNSCVHLVSCTTHSIREYVWR